MKTLNLYPVICFSAFVIWLSSIIMDGPLLQAIEIFDATNMFLPAHIFSLLAIGFFCPHDLFKRLVPANCVLTVILTLSIPLADPSVSRYLLIAAGICGAFVAISACMSLRQSTTPLLSAVFGLGIANVLPLLFGLWPNGGIFMFAAATLPILAIPLLTHRLPDVAGKPSEMNLWRYLPVIFLFQIVSGLMYAFIIPAYQDIALLPGINLLFYIAGVIAAFHIAQKNRELAMVCGVMLGMVAFTLLQGDYQAVSINISMFAIMSGAGIIDLVLIAILLTFPEPIKAFGIGLAIFCAGILGGKILGLYYADMTGAIVIAGHLILNVSVLTLYFLGRYYHGAEPPIVASPPIAGTAPAMPGGMFQTALHDAPPAGTAPIPVPEKGYPAPVQNDLNNHSEMIDKIPDHLRLLLSEREYDVFKRAIAGHTYRETARELDISESSVKTYMGRIYEKMGVRNKKQLFDMLNHLH